MKSVEIALSICNNLLIQYLFDYRFFTGENVWSAYVNITKCRIKSEAISPRFSPDRQYTMDFKVIGGNCLLLNGLASLRCK